MKKVEAGGTLEVRCGETFRVVRKTRPDGYLTTLWPNKALRHERCIPIRGENPQLIGGDQTFEDEYVALEAGEHELLLHIARPWEKAGGEDVVTRIRAVAA